MTQPRFKVKRGDFVQVTTGKDKGKRGVVTKVDLDAARVIIQGLGQYVRHIRPSMQAPEGKLEKQHSYHISNVVLVNQNTNAIEKVGYKIDENGQKIRFFKKSQDLVPVSTDHIKKRG
jgi:large subunit ribosomal protein L24